MSKTYQTYGVVFPDGDILGPQGYIERDEEQCEVRGWTRAEAQQEANHYGCDAYITPLARVPEKAA